MKKTKNSIDPPIKNLFSSSSNKEKKASLNESLQNSLNFKNKSLKNEEIELEINENDAKPEHKIQLTGDLNYYKQKHRFNKSLIQNTEETIKPRKKELKKLKKMRLEFLKNLLKKGKDFRFDYDSIKKLKRNLEMKEFHGLSEFFGIWGRKFMINSFLNFLIPKQKISYLKFLSFIYLIIFYLIIFVNLD